MRYVKSLSQETKHVLQRLYKQSKHYRVRQRAHCILLSAQGYCIRTLMEIFSVSRRTMINWLNAWETRRLPGLYDLKGKGKKPTFTSAQKEQIKVWSKRFPKNMNKLLALVKETFGISVGKRTIIRVLKSLNCSWRRIRRTPKGKPDPQEYEQKQQELETFKQREDEGEIDLFYFDESGFCLIPLLPYAWQEIGDTIEVPSGDKQRLNVAGFLSRKKQFHAWIFEASINSDVVIACFDAFCEMITRDTVVVLDNASFHTSQAVEEKIEEWKGKGLTLFFLPKYSPELNLIEILWRFMKYEWIEFGAYKGWKNLVEYIEDVIIHYGTKYVINFV
jgi:transposase